MRRLHRVESPGLFAQGLVFEPYTTATLIEMRTHSGLSVSRQIYLPLTHIIPLHCAAADLIRIHR
jgi:hypothetical protein